MASDRETRKGRDADTTARSEPTRASSRQDADDGVGNLDVQRSVKQIASRMEGDFSDVRVHPDAAEASALDARAFTIGADIYLAPGALQAGDRDRLLAHELAHVQQQRRTSIDRGAVEPDGSAAEREADVLAEVVAAGGRAPLASAAPRGIPRDAGAARRGEIADAYGVGYNKILANAGPGAKGAIYALAALETPGMFVDIDKFKKLDTATRRAILALEGHAKETGCAGWFDTLRANDPDKPPLTEEEIRAGELAYYESMRDARIATRNTAEAPIRAAASELSPSEIYNRWKEDRHAFVTAAQAPGHGIKAEQMHQIFLRYWGDRHDLALGLRQATLKAESDKDFDAYLRKMTSYEEGHPEAFGESFANAVRTIAIAELMFRLSVNTKTVLVLDEARGKAYTIDELTQRMLDYNKYVWAPATNIAGALAAAHGPAGSAPRTVRTTSTNIQQPPKPPPAAPTFTPSKVPTGKMPPFTVPAAKPPAPATATTVTGSIATTPLPGPVMPMKPAVKPAPITKVPAKPATPPIAAKPAATANEPRFPKEEFPSSDQSWKQWPPPAPSGDKPSWDGPGGSRYRYDRYRYQKWEDSGKSATPPKDLMDPATYYGRFVAPKARGQSPGEQGSPAHRALVDKVKKDNGVGTATMGEKRPDAVGEKDQPLQVGDGPPIKPGPGQRVLYEAETFFKDGSQMVSKGREQVRQFRKDNPDATIVVQDTANPKNIVVYPPGTQPPPPGPLPANSPNSVPVTAP
ncbi:MAG: DUF4157 domain-containing protein [Kofleriaceae bacterium]